MNATIPILLASSLSLIVSCFERDITPKRIGDSKSARIQLRLSIIEKRQSTEVRDIYCSSSDKDDCVIIHNMKKTAAFHLSAGLCKEALHTLSGCLALQQKMNGKESVEVAETLNMMGTVMAILGTEYHYRAVAAFEQALEIYQQQLGIGSEESAACRKNLCMLLNQRLNYDVRCKHLSIRSVSMFQNWAFVKDQYQYGTVY